MVTMWQRLHFGKSCLRICGKLIKTTYLASWLEFEEKFFKSTPFPLQLGMGEGCSVPFPQFVVFLLL